MIGLRKGTVKIVPYTSEWSRMYFEEAPLINNALDKYIIDVQHVGSTAVEGLDAKPIIDIAVGIRDYHDANLCIDPLKHLGYEYIERLDAQGWLFFTKGTPQVFQLHLLRYGNDLWNDYLLFRDCLRRDKRLAYEYVSLKKELAEKYANDRNKYTDEKVQFINKVLQSCKPKSNNSFNPTPR